MNPEEDLFQLVGARREVCRFRMGNEGVAHTQIHGCLEAAMTFMVFSHQTCQGTLAGTKVAGKTHIARYRGNA